MHLPFILYLSSTDFPPTPDSPHLFSFSHSFYLYLSLVIMRTTELLSKWAVLTDFPNDVPKGGPALLKGGHVAMSFWIF